MLKSMPPRELVTLIRQVHAGLPTELIQDRELAIEGRKSLRSASDGV